MQELTMFYLEGCPYCRRARGYMDELRAENPAYNDIKVDMVEERQQADLADSYDYYYVPTYFIGQEKLHEGSIDKQGVKDVLDRCMA